MNQAISRNLSDHGTSHYRDNMTRDVYIAYRRFHARQLRYLMDKLDQAKILDQTTIVYGSEFGDGRSHTRSPQPHLIAGGGGLLKMNQVINGNGRITSNDVYATVLTALGQSAPTFGERASNTGLIPAMMRRT